MTQTNPEPREAGLCYHSGFGNECSSEALPGALPAGRIRRSGALWLVRRAIIGHGVHRAARPQPALVAVSDSSGGRAQAVHAICQRAGLSRNFAECRRRRRISCAGIRCRCPAEPTDFVDGWVTMAGNGSAESMNGCAIHLYAANRSMQDRFFYSADGEC